MTKWAPEVFVDKSLIHGTRLINYVMFVLNSIFEGGINHYMEYFSLKLKTKQETLPMFIAPFVGILKNIYSAASDIGSKENNKFDNCYIIFN